MSFATVVGDRQLAYITKILAIFGVVEERQMRELFSYLPAAKYGRIMTRLSSEGLVYRTSDAKYQSVLLEEVQSDGECNVLLGLYSNQESYLGFLCS